MRKLFILPLLIMLVALFIGCNTEEEIELSKPLPGPSNIRVKAESPRAISISFEPVDGASSYIIYWGEIGGYDDGTQKVYKSYSLSYPYRISHSFKPGTEYSLQVQSVDSSGKLHGISDGGYVTTWIPAPNIYLTPLSSKSFAIHIESEVLTLFNITVDGKLFKGNVAIGPNSPFAESYTTTTTGLHLVKVCATRSEPHAEEGIATVNLK